MGKRITPPNSQDLEVSRNQYREQMRLAGTESLAADLREIELTKGKSVVMDADDYFYLKKWQWHTLVANGKFYAKRDFLEGFKIKSALLHRIIMNPQGKMTVDHIDGNGLNNQKSNLRLCTHRENLCNRKKNFNSKFKFKGIYKYKKKWCAYICPNGIKKHLGVFRTQNEAATEYDKAAKKLFGEFANLNFK